MASTTDDTLDLDALEREDTPDPFYVTLGGHRYLMSDPKGISWEALAEVQGRHNSLASTIVDAEEREAFGDELAKLPGWKIDHLAGKYNEHYGLPSRPE